MTFQPSYINSLNTQKALVVLWNSVYPKSIGFKDRDALQHYLDQLEKPKHWLLKNKSVLSGWCFTYIRESETWFAILLKSDAQGTGHGKAALQMLKTHNTKLNGWVIDHNNSLLANSEPYHSPLKFYLKQGFRVQDTKRLENENISAVKISWP